jgi:hypothetical protein
VAISVAQARQICTKAELDLVLQSTTRQIGDLDGKQLRASIRRARTLRDKWRDLANAQTRDTKVDDPGNLDRANARSGEKAELFDEALTRFEKRLAKVDSAVNGASSGGTSKNPPKKVRAVDHRASRSETRGALNEKTDALNDKASVKKSPAKSASSAASKSSPAGKASAVNKGSAAGNNKTAGKSAAAGKTAATGKSAGTGKPTADKSAAGKKKPVADKSAVISASTTADKKSSSSKPAKKGPPKRSAPKRKSAPATAPQSAAGSNADNVQPQPPMHGLAAAAIAAGREGGGDKMTGAEKKRNLKATTAAKATAVNRSGAPRIQGHISSQGRRNQAKRSAR